MIDPEDFELSSYDYQLNRKSIAQEPLDIRHNSKMLVVEKVKEGCVKSTHKIVWDLHDYLQPNDLLVVNNTKVIKARLIVKRNSGGHGELLLIEPLEKGEWLCLVKPGKRIRKGDSLWLNKDGHKSIELKVKSVNGKAGVRVIKFPESLSERVSMEAFLSIYGEVPLPPYIEQNNSDNSERYQTCYAKSPGAVAAPTAGLHLSKDLLREIESKGVNQADVTLHVGLGTFKPLEENDLNNLTLHSEWVEVSQSVVDAVKNCRKKGGRVIAVGTTTVRALEGAFVAGDRELKPYKDKVSLVIKPGYRFGVVNGLLTNFHLPKSSLLLLVSAMIGRKTLLSLYAEAIEKKYRFYSYGDAMLICPEAFLLNASSYQI